MAEKEKRIANKFPNVFINFYNILNLSWTETVFTALSDAFLKSGDAVVAAVYNYENHTVEFQMILDEKQRERAKGSKYMQSKPGDIYQEAYHWLMDT